jgi:hypothetical protein
MIFVRPAICMQPGHFVIIKQVIRSSRHSLERLAHCAGDTVASRRSIERHSFSVRTSNCCTFTLLERSKIHLLHGWISSPSYTTWRNTHPKFPLTDNVDASEVHMHSKSLRITGAWRLRRSIKTSGPWWRTLTGLYGWWGDNVLHAQAPATTFTTRKWGL